MFFTVEAIQGEHEEANKNRKSELEKINECFSRNFPPAFFVPITVDRGFSFSTLDGIKLISEERRSLARENDMLRAKNANLRAEISKMESEAEDLDFYQEKTLGGWIFVFLISLILILCIVGIILGIWKFF